MRRHLVVLLALTLLVALAGAASSPAKSSKCAKEHEQRGCVLPPDTQYAKGAARVAVQSGSFNFKEITAKVTCSEGGTKLTTFDVGNGEPATEKKAKVGQTQSFEADTIFIDTSGDYEDEIPVTLVGKVTFVSARTATVKATLTAKYSSTNACTAPIELTFKRVHQSALPGR